jgi:hypothetical protein
VQAAQNAIQAAVNIYTGQLYTPPVEPAPHYGPIELQPGGNQQPNNIYSQVEQSPSSLTSAQQSQFEADLNAQSNEPNSAQTFETSAPYASTEQQIQNAVQQAGVWNQPNNVADISTALQPFETQNSTTGDTTLDSLLLSQVPGAYSQIQQEGPQAAAGLQGQLNTAATGADQALQNAISTDTADTQSAQAAAQTFATNLTNYLNSTLAANQAAQNTAMTENNALSTDLASGTLTAADAQAMGIPAAQAAAYATDFNSLNPEINAIDALNSNPARDLGVTGLSPISLSSYLTQTPAPTLDIADTATAQNYADVAALQSLMGGNALALPIGAATANQAGLGLGTTAADAFNTAGSQSALNPVLQHAINEQAVLSYSAAIDPAQNGGDQAVINAGNSDIANIIAYLDQLTGLQGTGITQPTNRGYTTNV